MSIKKDNCIIGTKIIVNDKVTKWNENVTFSLNQNGLHAWKYNTSGHFIGDTDLQIPINTTLEIVDKVKRRKNGTSVLFKIQNEDTIYESFWCCIKPKTDLI
jgi:hypothetical protein